MLRVIILSLATLCATGAGAQTAPPQQLLAPFGGTGEFFGSSCAIDGDTLVVSRQYATVPSLRASGALVYRWNGSAWGFEAELVGSGASAGDGSVSPVAISGNTVVLGNSYNNNGPQWAGTAYVFVRTAAGWIQQAKLDPPSPVGFQHFGHSVAIDGDTILVGIASQDFNEKGRAHVFVRTGTTWSYQTQLTASDGAANDQFGYSVAVTGDTAVVGAFQDQIGANGFQGSAYVFTRTATAWTQRQKLTASDGTADDSFGSSMAIDGNTLLVGAFLCDAGGGVYRQGGAYVFTREFDGMWHQQARLSASIPTNDARFGSSVAIRGDYALVGAPNTNIGAVTQAGAAFFFRRSESLWTQTDKIVVPDGATLDRLGYAVGLSDSTAVISVSGDDIGAAADQGSALVFSRVGSCLLQGENRAVASDAAANDYFGFAVGLSGNTAVVGAFGDDAGAVVDRGSIYVLARSGSTWDQIAGPLGTPDSTTSDNFGRAVAIHNDSLIVGSPFHNVGANADQGTAYGFARSGSMWNLQTIILKASDGAASDFFGFSVGISDFTAIIGAYGDDTGAVLDHGSAYIFTKSGLFGDWTQNSKLLAPDLAAGDFFGYSVAISGDTAVVGAYGKAGSKGAAYVFVREGGVFAYSAKLQAGDGVAGDSFGINVAIEGDTIVVGASKANAGRGAAYVFARSGGVFSQVAKLGASDGSAGDNFGLSVGVSGSNILVGACSDTIGNKANAGSCYVYTSASGTPAGPYVSEKKYVPTTVGAGDFFAFSCAISGTSLIGGSSGSNGGKGAVTFFDVFDAGQNTVLNTSTGTLYPTVPGAMAAATSGQSILASAGAFNTAPLNFAGKSLSVASRSSISLNYTSLLTLNAGSSLSSGSGFPMDIYCPAQTPADGGRATLSANTIRFGNLASVFVNSGELFLNAPMSELSGSTILRAAGSAVTASGDLAFRGALNATVGGTLAAGGDLSLDGVSNLFNANISAGGVVRVSDQANLLYVALAASDFVSSPSAIVTLSGTVAGHVSNFGKLLISADLAVLGGFVNNPGAVLNLGNNSMYLFGSMAQNGTLTGTINGCPNCLLSPSQGFTIEQSLTLGSEAVLSFTGTIEVGGAFDAELIDPLQFEMRAGALRMNAGVGGSFAGTRTLEVMSHDYGAAGAAVRPLVPGSYPIASLELGPAPTTVTLADVRDNDANGQGTKEALYLDSLIVPLGSRLNTGAIRVYARAATINGTVDHPGNIFTLPPPCDADLAIDSLVDDRDFEVFAAAYTLLDCADPHMATASRSLPGGCPADLNEDRVVDDADFNLFVASYDVLLCP